MSHYQNLQTLRSCKRVSAKKELNPYSSSKDKHQFKLKLDNLPSLRMNLNSNRQAYDKFLDSQTLIAKKPQLKRLSGSSLSIHNKRLQSPIMSTLSIYNISTSVARKESISNPLTDRREYASLELEDFEQPQPKNNKVISKSSFNIVYIIGKGGFSKVWKVHMKKSGRAYAMKEMFKTKIIDKKSIHSVMNQRKLLSELNHPFLVNMNYAFQDKDNLYLIMDYLNGGDLRYHMNIKRFTQNQAKFFIACLLLSVNYLHSHGVIHRDIKPENLVMDSSGYLRLTDLGISNRWRQNNAIDTSGTPGYMAPQVLRHKNHSFVADFFAVGILMYELMLDKRPYVGRRKQIAEQVMVKQAFIKPQEVPRGWSLQAADFANKLMIRNPQARLGAKGDDQVRKHPWLKSVDWGRLVRKQIPAPYIPTVIQDNYEQYRDQISQDSQFASPQENALLLRNKQTQNLFNGYQYPPLQKNTKSTKSTFQSNSSLVQISDDLLRKIFRSPRKSK